MAQYQHLPIYKATYDLLLKVTEATRHFPRDFKHSLAAMLREEVLAVVVLIYRANSARDKRTELLDQVVERMQVVELMLRLSKDMRFLSIKQFSSIVELTDSVLRQASGWRKTTASAA